MAEKRGLIELLEAVSQLPAAEADQLFALLSRTRQAKQNLQTKQATGAKAGILPASETLRPEWFRRLYAFPAPNPALADYYVDVLSQCRHLAFLSEARALFRQYERQPEHQNLEASLDRYRARIVKKLLATKAFRCLAEGPETQAPAFEPVNRPEFFEGRILLAFRLMQEGYAGLLRADAVSELPMNWVEMARALDVPLLLAHSRWFRHWVLSDLCGTMHQHHQQMLILELLDTLLSVGVGSNQVVRLTETELVIAPGNRLATLVNLAHARPNIHLHFAIRFHQLAPTRDGLWVRARLAEPEPGAAPMYSELMDAPDNVFYPAFKRHILNQAPEPRDQFFVLDGRLAHWV